MIEAGTLDRLRALAGDRVQTTNAIRERTDLGRELAETCMHGCKLCLHISLHRLRLQTLEFLQVLFCDSVCAKLVDSLKQC